MPPDGGVLTPRPPSGTYGSAQSGLRAHGKRGRIPCGHEQLVLIAAVGVVALACSDNSEEISALSAQVSALDAEVQAPGAPTPGLIEVQLQEWGVIPLNVEKKDGEFIVAAGTYVFSAENIGSSGPSRAGGHPHRPRRVAVTAGRHRFRRRGWRRHSGNSSARLRSLTRVTSNGRHLQARAGAATSSSATSPSSRKASGRATSTRACAPSPWSSRPTSPVERNRLRRGRDCPAALHSVGAEVTIAIPPNQQSLPSRCTVGPANAPRSCAARTNAIVRPGTRIA